MVYEDGNWLFKPMTDTPVQSAPTHRRATNENAREREVAVIGQAAAATLQNAIPRREPSHPVMAFENLSTPAMVRWLRDNGNGGK